MARITTAYLRELESMVHREEISYGRMVELLNEKAAEHEQLWASGFVWCDLCGFNWVAARPAECTELECSNCGNVTTFTTQD